MLLWISYISALLISFATAPLIIWWYRKNNWVDNPETHRHAKVVHTQPVPRGGGLVVFVGLLLAAAALLHWDQYLVAIMVGAALLTIVGVLDDIFDLHPLTRLAVGAVATLIVIGAGIGIGYVSNPFAAGVIHLDWPRLTFWLLGEHRSIWLLADLFAFLFILGNMNTVNWSKGVDGQLPAFSIVSFLFISVLAGNFAGDPTNFGAQQLALIAAGAFTGLLCWNWYPQKMMPGYGGGALSGYLLAVLAILSGAKVATVLMVLAIPTADAVFTIARRLYRGKSPFWGDRGHLHHKLLDVYGWSKPAIALFYAGTSLLFGIVSLSASTDQKILTLVVAGLLVVGLQVDAKRRQTRAKRAS